MTNSQKIADLIATQQWARTSAGQMAGGLGMNREQFEQHQAAQRAEAAYEREHRFDNQWARPEPEVADTPAEDAEPPLTAADKINRHFQQRLDMAGVSTPPGDSRAAIEQALSARAQRFSADGRAELRADANEIAAELTQQANDEHAARVRAMQATRVPMDAPL